jgi:uncharacterized membrane protein
MANPRSTAQIAGHPIHPMLVPFPIAFYVATLVCDLVYWLGGYSAWADATPWLLGAGLIMAVLAVIMGLTDVLGDTRIRALNDVWWHAGANAVVTVIQLFNLYLRYEQGAAAIVPSGLVLSVAAIIVLLFAGWKGWELVYRHRVGISDDVEATKVSAQTRPPGTTQRAA